MIEKLKEYLDSLFAQVPQTKEVKEAKDELYDSMVERYEDCMRKGMDEQAAYDCVVDSIGDIRELIDELDLGQEDEEAAREKAAEEKAGQGFDLNEFVRNVTDYTTAFVSGLFGDGTTGEMRLANIVQVSLAGIESIEINYLAEAVSFGVSATEQLVVNEYLNMDDPTMFAETITKNGHVQVKHGRRGVFGLRSRIEVQVPADWQGALTLSTVSGRISSDNHWNLQSLTAKTVSGDIEIGGVKAAAVRLSSTSGFVMAHRAEGSLDLRSISGSLRVDEAIGNGTFSTTSGSVRAIFLGLDGHIRASSITGGIRLGVPAGVSFELDAKTTTGSVHTAFDDLLTFQKRHKAHGFVGGAPYYHISASSTSGGIHIND